MEPSCQSAQHHHHHPGRGRGKGRGTAPGRGLLLQRWGEFRWELLLSSGRKEEQEPPSRSDSLRLIRGARKDRGGWGICGLAGKSLPLLGCALMPVEFPPPLPAGGLLPVWTQRTLGVAGAEEQDGSSLHRLDLLLDLARPCSSVRSPSPPSHLPILFALPPPPLDGSPLSCLQSGMVGRPGWHVVLDDYL